MTAKNPFDVTSMFSMFDPEDVKKVFDPTKMFAAFETPQKTPFDMTGLFDTNRKNLEAMVEANKAAAGAYKDLLDKQMDVFGQLTSAAQEHVSKLGDMTGPDALSQQSKAYSEAVETAMGLMQQLAENARAANEEAYGAIKDQVVSAVEELSKKAPGGK